jgi:hypothetical protein
MIEAALLIAAGWFGHKYKDEILEKIGNLING